MLYSNVCIFPSFMVRISKKNMEHTEAKKGHLCLFFGIKRISD